MASETNELTFVRCPTCRSLVPASASRCRICNATLDAGSKAASDDAAPSAGGRVRQKTVATGPDEVKAVLAASAPPARSAPIPGASTPPLPVGAAPLGEREATEEASDDVFDPLGAFLQDLDSPSGSEVQSKKADGSPADLFDDEDGGKDEEEGDELDDFDLDDFDDTDLDDPLLDLEQDAPDAPQEEVAQVQEEDEGERNEDQGADPQEDLELLLDSVVQEPTVEPSRAVSQPMPEAPRKEPPQRQAPRPPETNKPQNRDAQPPVERATKPPQVAPTMRSSSGNIRPRIGGLPQRTEAPAIAPRAARSSKEQTPPPRTPEARDKPSRVEPRSSQGTQRATLPQGPAMLQVPAAQPTVSQTRPKSEVSPARVQPRPPAERSPADSEGAGARTSKGKQGRLFGWLVSYENPDGRAIELRAGRFFVTGTSIRPTDLILEDQSISTPHALMAITENGLQLQDLMSERGTFVRSQGEAQYTREDGVVEIQHGDWIRFGDVEFLVTVVPS